MKGIIINNENNQNNQNNQNNFDRELDEFLVNEVANYIKEKKELETKETLEEINSEQRMCEYCKTKKHQAKGLCAYHYALVQKAGLDVNDKKAVMQYLKNRDERILKDKIKKSISKRIKKKIVDIKVCQCCGRKALAHGLCSHHLWSARRLQLKPSDIPRNLEKIKASAPDVSTCIFCGKTSYAYGFCRSCLSSLRYVNHDPHDTDRCLNYLSNKKEIESIKIV